MRNICARRLSGIAVLAGLWALCAAGTLARAEATPAPDKSATTEQYEKVGVPSINKVWTSADYQQAADALKQFISGNNEALLPRYKSAMSGAVFAQIISQKNIDAITDKSKPIDDRMKMVQEIPAYISLFTLYAGAIKPGQTFDSETLELGGFVIRLELAAAQVADEFSAAHPGGNDDMVKAGMKKMRDGYAQTAGGMIEFMMDRANVRASEAARFAGELKDYLPKLAACLDQGPREELKAEIKKAAGKESDAGLKQALNDLAAAIK